MYKIYRRLNLLTGKSYIGLTSRDEAQRWKEHCGRELVAKNSCNSKLSKAIRKYGSSDTIWQVEILEDNIPNKYIAGRREVFYIWKYNSYKKGYNTTPGGIAGPDNSKKLILLNKITKEFYEFDNAVQAGEIINFKASSVTGAARKKTQYVGNYIVFYKQDFDENKIEEYINNLKKRKTKKVKAYYADTGEFYKVYSSIDDAGKDLNASTNQISKVARKHLNCKTAGQINNRRLTWEYA